jgi:hypothetical protein
MNSSGFSLIIILLIACLVHCYLADLADGDGIFKLNPPKMDNSPHSSKVWHELVGKSGNEAKEILEKEYPGKHIVVAPVVGLVADSSLFYLNRCFFVDFP